MLLKPPPHRGGAVDWEYLFHIDYPEDLLIPFLFLFFSYTAKAEHHFRYSGHYIFSTLVLTSNAFSCTFAAPET